jgi:UDP-N-acetylglucosamine 2-epimerase (non-hydrolysing)
MIHIVYGTRAELIKFSSLIKELQKRKLPFRLIDTGDHDTRKLRKELNLPKPHHYFGKAPREIWSTIAFPLAALLALLWGLYVFLRLVFVFLKEGKIVIYHGNTKTVPLVVLASKFLFFKKLLLVHYESGLRGKTKEARVFDFYRKIGDRFAHILFHPTETCKQNLQKEKVKGKLVYIGSPVSEVVKSVLKNKPKIKFRKNKFIFVSIARTLNNKRNITDFMKTLQKIPMNVLVVLNPRMKRNLKKYGLLGNFDLKKISFVDEMDYTTVIHAIKNSLLVITDSHGIQEECAVLKKPCIVTSDFIHYPELVEHKVATVTGWDGEKILKTIEQQLTNAVRPKTPAFYNGSAAVRATDFLERLL